MDHFIQDIVDELVSGFQKLLNDLVFIPDEDQEETGTNSDAPTE